MKKILLFGAMLLCIVGLFAKPKESSKEKTQKSQKSSAKIFDAAHISQAIENGDCAFLYEFTQSENPDATLLAKAKNTLAFYTSKQASLSQFHTDKIDSKVRKIPQEITEGVFAKPKDFLPQVVDFLVKGVSNDFIKVKILHDWICDNIAYDTEIYLSGRISGQDYISVIKKKKAVCAGYAATLNQMCSFAGIESKTISGFSKGAGYSGKTGSKPDHDWNAIKINGKWYLVDATWDAGYLDYKTYIKRYSTQYLFWDSRTFLYSHLAQNDGEQFYAPPLTKEKFEKEPKIEGRFFQKGLSFVDDKLCYSNKTNGEFQVEIKSSNSTLYVNNKLIGEREFVEGAAWTKRKGSTITLCYDVPDSADYKAGIYVQTPSATQDMISIPEFEGKWIPTVEQLLAEKKITQKEKEFFDGAYFKVQENHRYYLYDNQFATTRNAALEKIAKLVKPGVTHTQPILIFNLKASPDYDGFGQGNLKYPYCFATYNNATNTELLEPITGRLQAGTTQKFEVRSGNYSSFAFIIDKEWHFFEKNSSTGNYEIEFEIPQGIDKLQIYAGTSKTGRHNSLVWFEITE